VLIVDERPFMRLGIKHVVFEHFDFVSVADAAPGTVDLGPWDVAIVTIDLATPKRVQFLQALKPVYPAVRVIALAKPESISSITKQFGSTIDLCLADNSTPDQMVEAFARALLAKPFGNQKSEYRPRAELSQRELQVLRLLAAGRSTSMIIS
jgi:DNA-binding NarL/FixJ family response regulator